MAFNEHAFKARMDTALLKVRTVLDNSKNPRLASEVEHQYDDKYLLAEFLANTALASHLNLLETLGLSPENVKKMMEWSKKRSVSLCLTATEKSKFNRKETRNVESSTKYVRENTIFGKTTDKTVTKVTEYFWDFSFEYELFAFVGSDRNDKIVLQGRKGGVVVKTSSDSNPYPETKVRSPLQVNISWIFSRVNERQQFQFKIDRESKLCHTPRRNPEVNDALEYFNKLTVWCNGVCSYFCNQLFQVQQEHGLDLHAINSEGVFVPILPLFDPSEGQKQIQAGEEEPAGDVALVVNQQVIPISYMGPFLAEQIRSLTEKIGVLSKVFPSDDTIITNVEALLLVCMRHCADLTAAFSEGMNYIENLIRQQLISAIGKVVTPTDFANYMVFHNRKLFKKEYSPIPFCYAIRRPDHYPDGVLSLEVQNGDSVAEPVPTVVCSSIAKEPMFFSINAATKVGFYGERFLHSWIHHQFSDSSPPSLSLGARARQFSSFILMVGRISGPNSFDPKFATIIQNKDNVLIPLLLEQIPSAKEFRDAIESLSPEQQRFAKAFRGMQLESTLFAVCIIQIKPQLEKLLGLPEDSLTKEIKLTQDLLKLFIKYQIPSDLLSYDGPQVASPLEKVARVEGLVSQMNSLIDSVKKDALSEAKQASDYRNASSLHDVSLMMAPMPVPQSMAMPMPSMAMQSMAMQSMPMPPMESAMMPTSNAMPLAQKPQPPQPQPHQSQPPQQKKEPLFGQGRFGSSGEGVDFTQIPQELEQKFLKLDEDNALRPTIINPGSTWTKEHYASLLSPMANLILGSSEQESERDQAFDLLDAMTRSGILTIDEATLHVVIASTHCFDKSLMDTVVQDNVNPIEKVERSTLIVATTLHDKTAAELVKESELERVSTYSKILFQ